MFFLLILTLQRVYSYSYDDLYRVLPLPWAYKTVAPVYVAEVTSPHVRCLETTRSMSADGEFTYPVYSCWNELLHYNDLLKYKNSMLLASPPTNNPIEYNTLQLTGPIAYGQSSSWASSYGNPSLLSGVSPSAQASASASAGGLTASSSSSSSANTGSSATSGSYGYKPDPTSTAGSSPSSTGDSVGHYGNFYSSSGDGSTLTTRPNSINPTCTGYSSNYYLHRPSCAGSVVGSGVYYTGYNLGTSANGGVTSGSLGSTSPTSHPAGYYTAFYKPTEVSSVSSGGQDGHYNIYYYQPISPTSVGSGSSATSTTHYTGPGNYYNVYYKPTGTIYAGTATETSPSAGTSYSSTSSVSTNAGGTSGHYASYSGSQSNPQPTSGLQPTLGSHKPETGTNITAVPTSAVAKPWWLVNGVFAASLASSSTFGFPSQAIIPGSGTGSSSWPTGTEGVLGSYGNINSGTSTSNTVVGTSSGNTSETSSSLGTTSTVSTEAHLPELGSGSTWSSSTLGSGTISVPDSSTSQIGVIYSSISNATSTSSSAVSEVETGSNFGASFGSNVTTTITESSPGHVPSAESGSIESSGINLGTSGSGSSESGEVYSSGYSPISTSHLPNSSEMGVISMGTVGSSSFTDVELEVTTPTMVTSTVANNVPWWVSSGIHGTGSPFGSPTISGSNTSTSSSNIVSTIGPNLESVATTVNLSGPSQTYTATNMTGNNVQTTQATSLQTGTVTNSGAPWWLSGGLSGGTGAGTFLTSGSNIGFLSGPITGTGGSSSAHTGSGSSSSTVGSSTLGSVVNGTGSSSASSSGSGESSGPWWLSGALSGSGGGSSTTTSTGSNIESTVGSSETAVPSIPGNNQVFPLGSNSQPNFNNTSEGGSGAGSLLTPGSNVGSLTGQGGNSSVYTGSADSSSIHSGSAGSPSVHTGSGSSSSTVGSSTLVSVVNGTGSSSVSSSGSGGSSGGPWWLSGALSGSGGGSPTTNSTGNLIESTEGSSGPSISTVPGNDSDFHLGSNIHPNVNNGSGEPIFGTLGGIGSSILSTGIAGLSSLFPEPTGSNTAPSLSSVLGQSQTTGTGIGASSTSTSTSAAGSGLGSLPGAPNLPFPFVGGQSGIQSALGTSALSFATASASSGSIPSSTTMGGFPNKPNQPWWQTGGLLGLGSSPYLKSSEELTDGMKADIVSNPIYSTVSPTKSIELTNTSLFVTGNEK